MPVEWYCKVMGTEVGPLNQDQLVDMVRNHRVNPEDLVRRNNSQWVPAFEVKGLFEAAAKPAPPKPAPEPEEKLEEATETPAPVWTRADVGHQEPAAEDATEVDATPDWYCIADGQKRGPLDFKDLQDLAMSGTLRDRDRVWRGSAPKWRKAGEIKGLMAQ